MTLERWNPFKELENMRRDMDRIWVELFPPKREAAWRKPDGAKGTATPAIDIIDRDKEVLLKAEMPGVKKEDIEISYQDNTLSIKGEIKDDEEAGKENYSYSERDYRFYARAVSIPFKVRHDKITASLKDGVLSVHLPKLEEEQPKKITVNIQ